MNRIFYAGCMFLMVICAEPVTAQQAPASTLPSSEADLSFPADFRGRVTYLGSYNGNYVTEPDKMKKLSTKEFFKSLGSGESEPIGGNFNVVMNLDGMFVKLTYETSGGLNGGALQGTRKGDVCTFPEAGGSWSAHCGVDGFSGHLKTPGRVLRGGKKTSYEVDFETFPSKVVDIALEERRQAEAIAAANAARIAQGASNKNALPQSQLGDADADKIQPGYGKQNKTATVSTKSSTSPNVIHTSPALPRTLTPELAKGLPKYWKVVDIDSGFIYYISTSRDYLSANGVPVFLELYLFRSGPGLQYRFQRPVEFDCSQGKARSVGEWISVTDGKVARGSPYQGEWRAPYLYENNALKYHCSSNHLASSKGEFNLLDIITAAERGNPIVYDPELDPAVNKALNAKVPANDPEHPPRCLVVDNKTTSSRAVARGGGLEETLPGEFDVAITGEFKHYKNDCQFAVAYSIKTDPVNFWGTGTETVIVITAGEDHYWSCARGYGQNMLGGTVSTGIKSCSRRRKVN